MPFFSLQKSCPNSYLNETALCYFFSRDQPLDLMVSMVERSHSFTNLTISSLAAA